MSQKSLVTLFTALGVIGSLFSVVYLFFGLAILPVSEDVLVLWGNSVLGRCASRYGEGNTIR